MDFSIGNLVKSAMGAVAKVANVVVNTVKSAISGISGMFSSAAGSIGSALSGVMAALGVVDVDEDGEFDIDNDEDFLDEKFKLLVGASIDNFSYPHKKENEKEWAFKSYQISEEDMKDSPEYDPVTRNRDGIRVKKKASNGQYFTGRTDEFGMFVPDNIDAYFDADSYGNRKSIDSTLNKISKYTYVESKSSKDKKRATLCNKENFKLYVDVLQYEGSMGVKLNLFNGNAEFSPIIKVGIEGNGKLIDFPYEFKEIQLDGSKVKVDGSISLMKGDVGLMFDDGALKADFLGSFGEGTIITHKIQNGMDTSAKLEGDIGGMGFKSSKNIVNGDGGVKVVDVIGGGFEVETKKDTN
ncbi:hypothetical protein FDA48_18280 [Clostridium botulinum]|nr:hypothetical protein [Clostridium botulinum]